MNPTVNIWVSALVTALHIDQGAVIVHRGNPKAVNTNKLAALELFQVIDYS